MPYRLRMFALHLLSSVVLLTLVLAIFYFGWYDWPGWHLAGAEFVVGLMMLVDIGVGPLATLVVANPAKSRRKLQADIGFIVLVQLAALGYGARTLWEGRPLYYVFSGAQVDLVPAVAIDPEDVQIARSRGVTLVPEWYSLPRWVWASVPEDPTEFGQLLMEKLLVGGDVITMPQYFHPVAEATAAMRDVYLPIRSLLGAAGMDQAEYSRRLALLGKAEGAVGVLPVGGRLRQGAMVFDRATGELLAYWPVKVPKSPAKAD
jgi:hypothetical protein